MFERVKELVAGNSTDIQKLEQQFADLGGKISAAEKDLAETRRRAVSTDDEGPSFAKLAQELNTAQLRVAALIEKRAGVGAALGVAREQARLADRKALEAERDEALAEVIRLNAELDQMVRAFAITAGQKADRIHALEQRIVRVEAVDLRPEKRSKTPSAWRDVSSHSVMQRAHYLVASGHYKAKKNAQ